MFNSIASLTPKYRSVAHFLSSRSQYCCSPCLLYYFTYNRKYFSIYFCLLFVLLSLLLLLLFAFCVCVCFVCCYFLIRFCLLWINTRAGEFVRSLVRSGVYFERFKCCAFASDSPLQLRYSMFFMSVCVVRMQRVCLCSGKRAIVCRGGYDCVLYLRVSWSSTLAQRLIYFLSPIPVRWTHWIALFRTLLLVSICFRSLFVALAQLNSYLIVVSVPSLVRLLTFYSNSISISVVVKHKCIYFALSNSFHLGALLVFLLRLREGLNVGLRQH